MVPERLKRFQPTSDATIKRLFGVGDEPGAWDRAALQYLAAAAEVYFIVPRLFEWRFGEIGPLGWGLTVFLTAYLFVTAVGLLFRPRKQFHTTVPPRGDWLDRVGAFWLVACTFGPLLGWALTAVAPLTPGSWRWLYAGRVMLAAGLPILTALPLLRYVRGKAAWVSLPLLIGVTLLPTWSVARVSLDLRDGVATAPAAGAFLRHTGERLEP
jgi:hypothetical protein